MRLFTRVFAAQLVLLLFAGTAFAQFTTNWERTSRDGAAEPRPEWFGTGTERAIAYGVVDGVERLYVASRSTDPNVIRVLDPATGEDVEAEISLEGLAGGTYVISTVAVSDDGKLFVSNLTTSSSEANPFKVYMWDGEDAEPVVVVDYQENGYRLGDQMSVSGSVDDGTAVIYVARGTETNVLRWWMEENESTYEFVAEPRVDVVPNITVWNTPGWAVGKGPGIESGFYAGGRSTTLVREYDSDANTLGYLEWPLDGLNRNAGAGEYLTNGQSEVFVTYHPGLRVAAVHELDVDAADGVNVNKHESVYGITPVIGPTAEPISGDVASRVNEDGTITLFVLGTNNGIGAYTTTEALLPPAPQVLTVAEARAEGSGATVTFEAVVGRTMGAFTYLQDETAGITIRQPSGAFRDAVDDGTLQPGTRIRATGELSEFNSLLQINAGDLDDWEILGQEDAPEPTLITLQDLLENGEQYEGMVVRVEDLEISSEDGTFSAGTSYDVTDPTSGEDVVELRVPNASDTELVGVAVPAVPFTFEGAVGQFSSSDPEAGYQLMAILETDIIAPRVVPVLDEPAWRIDVGDVEWFANDNATRGADYNPATDHLLVTSRTGGNQVHVLHPATGERLGNLDMTGVEGTLGINEISVTEDGQIFSVNLATVNSDVRIFRWANEDAVPELVYEGQPRDSTRYGDVLHVRGTGDNVTIFTSGTGTHNIAMITPGTGDEEPEIEFIELEDDIARMGIYAVPGEDSLWVNGPGTALTKIGLDGTVGREVGEDVLSTAYGDIYHFEWRNRLYVLTGPQYQADHRFLLVDVTDAGNEQVVYETIGLGETANGNGVGFVTADWKRGNIIVGATNNAIAAFNLEQRSNNAPLAGGIITPLDSATVVIEGDADQMLDVAWFHAVDMEGDPVLHTWQLSTSESFDDVAFEAYTQRDTTTSLSYEALVEFLDDQGVEYNQTLTVYHRVVASDGELDAASAVSTLFLTRGTMTNVDGRDGLPTEFTLSGNYPNPFNPTTNIRFDLPEAADVRVEVYDILGRQVMVVPATSFQAGANHDLRVDASHLASGTYLYRVVAEMATGTEFHSGKMVLVK